MIFIVRTTVGRENSVMDNLASRAKNLQQDIKSIFHPGQIKGYIFVEAELEALEEAISGVPHVRGIIKKEVAFPEVSKFLIEKKIDIKVHKGDIIEILGGPFKNEKGKVTRVDEAKEEVTVELLEAAIPIPITVSLTAIRVIESQVTEEVKEGKSEGEKSMDAMLSEGD
jgi:transcription termination/antitermination protein NusG